MNLFETFRRVTLEIMDIAFSQHDIDKRSNLILRTFSTENNTKEVPLAVSPVSPGELTNILHIYIYILYTPTLVPWFRTTDENLDKYRLTAVFISVQRKLKTILLLVVF